MPTCLVRSDKAPYKLHSKNAIHVLQRGCSAIFIP